MSKIKVQYCSDLHLEFKENLRYIKENPLIPVAEILILAGDILPFALHNTQNNFIDFVADNYEKVFWIPGNHEYYHFDLRNVSNPLYEKLRSNIFLVNNYAEFIGDTQFIFSTLWSHIQFHNSSQIRQSLSDFFIIKNDGKLISVQDFNILHEDCFSFIEKSLEENKSGKNVVTTHHVPTLLNYPEKYKNSPLNDGFVVELFDFINRSNISHWIYGHHHANVNDFEIGKTKMLTNQLGYVKHGEQIGFRQNAFIEV